MTTATQTKVALTGSQVKEIQSVVKQMPKSIVTTFHFAKFTVTADKLTITFIDQELTGVELNYTLDTYNDNTTFFIGYDVLKAIKTSKKDVVAIETEGEKIRITQNGITTNLINLEIEFPALPILENELNTLTVDKSYIAALKDSITFASKSESRPVLTYINHANGNIIVTDSHRLFQASKFESIENNFLVSQHTAKLVSELMESATITIFERYIQYSNENVTVIQRVNDSNYPETSRIIPQTFTVGTVSVNVDQLTPIVDQIKKAKISRMNITTLTFSENKLTVRSEDNSITAELTVDTRNIDKDFKISMNGSYLLDVLKQIKTGNAELKFVGNTNPFIVQGQDQKELHLIVPIRNY